MDSETIEALRHLAGEGESIPAAMRHRISGSTIGEMKADARKLAVEIGVRPAQERDEQGRFTGDMNARLRAAAGR